MVNPESMQVSITHSAEPWVFVNYDTSTRLTSVTPQKFTGFAHTAIKVYIGYDNYPDISSNSQI
eukprot:1747146-Pleurochrysis_carterae.AAC.1